MFARNRNTLRQRRAISKALNKIKVETIWDHAAGSLIVEEAGGRVTDLQGVALDFTTGRKLTKNRGIIATNGPFHDQVLDAVKSLL